MAQQAGLNRLPWTWAPIREKFSLGSKDPKLEELQQLGPQPNPIKTAHLGWIDPQGKTVK
jgi:hypothetical protein